ncbi:hypothetical protein [Celeribacter baekdonensis]|jgi:hypothetical protein|uniref:Transmembrane protein n=1 Tax=Celeribacter baekdonensis B30 TaxID=1208323 RepID=K2J7G1_9RHOB|nr:hypothetical protein [Celeribacter baekdonensis]EKE70857.1 hypothetical protein B30_12677 [Celeribacter baekdonensis B30]
MLLEFIATITAGVGAAGFILGLQKLTRIKFPKWAMPAAAGAAMLAFAIWSDYSWYNRALDGIGEGKVVATTIEKSQVWRPWTYLVPVTTRFIALDKDGATVEDGTVMTDMYLMARRGDAAIVPTAFDCIQGRRADLVGLKKGPINEMLAQADWYAMQSDNPILRTACDALR